MVRDGKVTRIQRRLAVFVNDAGERAGSLKGLIMRA
jgi:hypothetical protein